MKKRLRILDTTWHVMSAYDLCYALRDDADFFFVHNVNRSWKDERFLAARPLPQNVTFVPYVEPEKYDLAILHLDQQCLKEDIGKRKVFLDLYQETVGKLPVYVHMHGSPIWPEYLKLVNMTDEDAKQECRRLIKQMIGNLPMLVNSYDSVKEWGWGFPIWHGINPQDWWDLPKEPRIFTAISNAGLDFYYNRACLNEVIHILNKEYNIPLWWARENTNSHDSWDHYRNWMGRSLLYIDLSYHTPMNRGRTEAMLSGCCVIQIEKAHDLDRFAKDRDNIILVPNNPEKIVQIIIHYLNNKYDEAVLIGQKGKQTAINLFSPERYRQEILQWMNDVIKNFHESKV